MHAIHERTSAMFWINMCDEHVFNCFFPFSSNIQAVETKQLHIHPCSGWILCCLMFPFFLCYNEIHTNTQSERKKTSERKKKLKCIRIISRLDDAFHCDSTCTLLLLLNKGSRAWIHRVFIVMSPLQAHSKRVDFKFIFICLDLSLELFFISLTISSTFE